jgi:serine protease Do
MIKNISVLTAAFSLNFIIGCTSFTSSDMGAGGTIIAPDFQSAIKCAKEKVFPALVFIITLREEFREGKKVTFEACGSGVIISPDGEVLTNWHVTDKATEIRCLLFDGTSYEAKLKGDDKDSDLALLKLKLPEKYPPIPYAVIGDSSKLKEGDFVMALGAPWGLSRSISVGIISCSKRFLPMKSEYNLWLQTDASISPGNSGGPLVNIDGAIVGINSLGSTMGGDMGFAIPTETILQIIPQLREHGKVNWTWTGLLLQPLKDFRRNTYFNASSGVIISGTEQESPARQSGILSGDRIIKLNGKPITAITEEDLPDIRRKLGLLPKGKPVTFELEREGKLTSVEFTPREKGEVEGMELDCPRWDFTVKTINQFDNPELYFYRKKGLFIYGVKNPGNAQICGLQRNDIVISIDGGDVEALEDIKAIHKLSVENVKDNPRVLVNVLRNGSLKQAVLEFSRDFEK